MLQVIWRRVVLFLLWPLWWPIMVILLVATAGPLAAQDPTRKRSVILYNAWALALLCLGCRDPK